MRHPIHPRNRHASNNQRPRHSRCSPIWTRCAARRACRCPGRPSRLAAGAAPSHSGSSVSPLASATRSSLSSTRARKPQQKMARLPDAGLHRLRRRRLAASCTQAPPQRPSVSAGRGSSATTTSRPANEWSPSRRRARTRAIRPHIGRYVVSTGVDPPPRHADHSTTASPWGPTVRWDGQRTRASTKPRSEPSSSTPWAWMGYAARRDRACQDAHRMDHSHAIQGARRQQTAFVLPRGATSQSQAADGPTYAETGVTRPSVP